MNSQHAKITLSKLGTETFVKECKGTKHFMKVQSENLLKLPNVRYTQKKTNKVTEELHACERCHSKEISHLFCYKTVGTHTKTLHTLRETSYKPN